MLHRALEQQRRSAPFPDGTPAARRTNSDCFPGARCSLTSRRQPTFPLLQPCLHGAAPLPPRRRGEHGTPPPGWKSQDCGPVRTGCRTPPGLFAFGWKVFLRVSRENHYPVRNFLPSRCENPFAPRGAGLCCQCETAPIRSTRSARLPAGSRVHPQTGSASPRRSAPRSSSVGRLLRDHSIGSLPPPLCPFSADPHRCNDMRAPPTT